MEIKILGSNCQNCNTFVKRVKNIVAVNNINANVKKIEDIEEIMSYNILSTPGLVIDGKVVSSGRLLTEKEIEKLLIN